ncbi:MAG: endonuclease/exonuclease/phosphatase family protein [Chlorobiaceae bacterium]|nr:endonuclease/exonuclease/phosphatase family protein [Chlorobiaceae bacterium]
MHLPRAFVVAILLLALPCREMAGRGQQKTLLLMWWNVENLFDTRDDPNTEDDEFTPAGRLHWTEKKLLLKRIRIAAVLGGVSLDRRFGSYPDLIAFAESENRQVFAGTIASAGLGAYRIAYHESPDPRGIDIGLAWNPATVSFTGSRAYRVSLPDHHRTRDVIVAGFLASGHPFSVVLNHWPSRSFDRAWSEPKRLAAAAVTRHVVDSLRTRDANAAIVVMGDFNDQPENRSLREVLGSSFDRKEVRAHGGRMLYNCWNEVRAGGSYAYHGQWERIDQVLVSSALLGNRNLHLGPKSFTTFSFPHMFAIPGKKLYTTFEKGRYVGGYSDHLPLLLKIGLSEE